MTPPDATQEPIMAVRSNQKFATPRTDLLATLEGLIENPTGDEARLIALQEQAEALWAKVESFTDTLLEVAAVTGKVDPSGREMLRELTSLHTQIDIALGRAIQACYAVN
jgi:hypothetical protein